MTKKSEADLIFDFMEALDDVSSYSKCALSVISCGDDLGKNTLSRLLCSLNSARYSLYEYIQYLDENMSKELFEDFVGGKYEKNNL